MKKLIEYLHRYIHPRAKDDIRLKCVNYLLPFATEFQRSLPSAMQFDMMDTHGNKLFTLLNENIDTLCECCENCARELNYRESMLKLLREKPEAFAERYKLDIESLEDVADIKMCTLSSDTNYYGMPCCQQCGAVLNMNCVPEGEGLYEDLTFYGELKTLCFSRLHLRDLWYITKLLLQAEKSKETCIQEAADKLAQRIYMENNLKDRNL